MSAKPPKEQVINAYKAGKAWGIEKHDLRPVLYELYISCGRNWEYIEAEHFRVLIEKYNNKRVEEKRRERTSKRLRRAIGDPGSSRSGSSENDPSLPLMVSWGNNKNGFMKPKGKLPINGVAATSSRSSGPMRIQQYIKDITKSTEKVEISLVGDTEVESLPEFNYITENTIYENAYLNNSLARIGDDDCCKDCTGDCLSSEKPCACSHDTCGEFAYTTEGLLKEDFLSNRISHKHRIYCGESHDCPIEKNKNKSRPGKCKGHLYTNFIKECWRKCGCNMNCGNRVVQRGISCKLQVYWFGEGKGWGVRTLEVLEKGSFVCEYVGEILTNEELDQRNNERRGTKKHTYPVNLDADWASERILRDEEALCLDATHHGNVARFINHRCSDANLVDIPVQIDSPDRHYYHLAFFTTRKVNAFEELNWDYGIDFDDKKHPVEGFECKCESKDCRDPTRRKGKKVATLG